MKIRPVGAELFRSDEQAEGQDHRHDEDKSHFSQFGECA
jgi:hypothetical protein